MGASTSGKADALLLSFVSVRDVSRVVGWGSIIKVASESTTVLFWVISYLGTY